MAKKHTVKKRGLALVLVMVMMFSMLPVTALAAGQTTPIYPTNQWRNDYVGTPELAESDVYYNTVVGRIEDENGDPVPNAILTCPYFNGSHKTEEDGSFEIPLAKDGYADEAARLNIEVEGQKWYATLYLNGRASFYGVLTLTGYNPAPVVPQVRSAIDVTVVDESGNPIEGATVQAFGGIVKDWCPVGDPKTTDAKGFARLESNLFFAGATYTVTATAEGYENGSVSGVSLDENHYGSCTITLKSRTPVVPPVVPDIPVYVYIEPIHDYPKNDDGWVSVGSISVAGLPAADVNTYPKGGGGARCETYADAITAGLENLVRYNGNTYDLSDVEWFSLHSEDSAADFAPNQAAWHLDGRVRTYNVAYDLNNANATGTVPTDSTVYTKGQAFTPAEGTDLALANSTFLGWSTDPNATAADTFSGVLPVEAAKDGTITLYAVWQEQVSIRYYANHDSTVADAAPALTDSVAKGQDAIAAEGLGQWTDHENAYTFSAWNTRADGTGDSYVAGADILALGEDLDLFAQWTSDPLPAKVYVEVVYQYSLDDGAPQTVTSAVPVSRFEIDPSQVTDGDAARAAAAAHTSLGETVSLSDFSCGATTIAGEKTFTLSETVTTKGNNYVVTYLCADKTPVIPTVKVQVRPVYVLTQDGQAQAPVNGEYFELDLGVPVPTAASGSLVFDAMAAHPDFIHEGVTYVRSTEGTYLDHVTQDATVDGVTYWSVRYYASRYTTGSLTIEKTIRGLESNDQAMSSLVDSLSFTITGPNDYSKTVSYTDTTREFRNASSGSKTLSNLAPGVYTIEEQNAEVSGYELSATNDGSVQVTVSASGTPAVARITNTYTSMNYLVSFDAGDHGVLTNGTAGSADARVYNWMTIGDPKDSYFNWGYSSINGADSNQRFTFRVPFGLYSTDNTAASDMATSPRFAEAQVVTADSGWVFDGFFLLHEGQELVPFESLEHAVSLAGDYGGNVVFVAGYHQANGNTTPVVPVVPGSTPGDDDSGYAPGENPLLDRIIPDEEVPLDELPAEITEIADIPDEETPLADIPDEEVPLADVPETGDGALLWASLSGLSGLALAVLAIAGKKRKDQEA